MKFSRQLAAQLGMELESLARITEGDRGPANVRLINRVKHKRAANML